MKKSVLTLIGLLFVCLQGFAQNTTKNSVEFGLQFCGLPISDMNIPIGCMATVGYDFVPYKKNLIFSLQPHVGGGLFAYKQTNGTGSEYDFKYKYNIGAWEVGLTPKLYYPIVEDELYCYLANEFNFINLYARVWDSDKAGSRRSNKYMNFYYTCKIGVLVKTWKQNMAFWVGYTTLDFANTINKNRPHGISAYHNEKPGICFGASFYW